MERNSSQTLNEQQNMNKRVTAYIHSLKDKTTDRHIEAEAVIIEHRSNNEVIAEYNGIRCTAIFNPFIGAYFVDDIYGIIEREQQN